MKSIAILFAAGIALAPVVAMAQPTPDYLRDAGASDLFERQSATTVLQGTRNADVRRFAEMMIRDHTNSTNMVKAAAREAHARVGTPHLNADQSRMLAALRHTRAGTARDQLYIQQQRMSHDAALQVQQDYASNGSAAPLRQAAGNIVPVVQQHIAMLQGMGSGAPMAGHNM